MSFHKDREGRSLRIYIRFYPTTLQATNAFREDRARNSQDGKVYVIDHTRSIVDYQAGTETWYRKIPNPNEVWMYRGIEIQETPYVHHHCMVSVEVQHFFLSRVRPK